VGGEEGDDGGSRAIRDSPFAWQHREALDAIGAHYDGARRVTAIAVYVVVTWLASEARTPDQLTAYLAEIAERAGVSTDTARRYLHELEALRLLRIERRRIGERVNDANKYHLTTPPGAERGTGTGARRGSAGAGSPAGASASSGVVGARVSNINNKDEERDQHQQAAAVADADPLLGELLREGIDPRTAADLLATAGPELVDGWLAVASWREARNPVGVLISHLRRGDPPPPPPENPWERYRRERGDDRRGAD